MKIKFQRWPGQKQPYSKDSYGWTHKSCGGWRWKLGLLVGRRTVILDLILGSIRISWEKK